MTESGRRTRQGILYRGCGIDGGTQGVIRSEKGDEMLSSLGIAYQMDLRAEHESNLEVKRPISSAKFARHHFCGYEQFFKEENFEKTRSVFRALANKNNYPMYFHCAAGADRTGTLTFLINGLCGVSEKELIQDYEFTSFSVFGHRSLIHGTNYETDESMKGFLDILYTYKGDTLSSKIENLLLSVGVMEEEIYNIKAIMFGDVIV